MLWWILLTIYLTVTGGLILLGWLYRLEEKLYGGEPVPWLSIIFTALVWVFIIPTELIQIYKHLRANNNKHFKEG